MNPSSQQNFWKKFAKINWEKAPLLLQDSASTLQEIKEDQIFSMLVDYSNQCRKLKSPQGFKLFVEGQLQYAEDLLQFLPVKKDKSFLGYHARMEKYFSDYCLVCDELLQVSQENRKPLQQFTENLFSHVGFPNRFVEMGLYLGNYKKTPFGVHVDGCGVFSFPVVGKKTFRLWTPSFVEKNPALNRAHSYSKFKKHSQVLEARPGDMTYWPSSAWHIAESDGSFSATWSLGVWVDRSHFDVIQEALSPLLRKTLGVHGETKVTGQKNGLKSDQKKSLHSSDGQVVDLPKNFQETILKIESLSKNELHDAFLKSWLELISKQGFKTFPLQIPPNKISLDSEIQISSLKSILWSKNRSKKMISCAFQGTVIELSPSHEMLYLIKDLNLGKQCRISDYLGLPKNKKDLASIQILADAGAFS